MRNGMSIAVKPKVARMTSAKIIMDAATERTAARKAYRTKIESLLAESKDERLAHVWQRVYPFPIDPACELPDRRGIIQDLADFAEVLQPRLEGMKPHRLCRLVEHYAAHPIASI